MGKKKSKEQVAPLDQGLIMLLRALDNQIAREMQRTPADREEQGVQKWQPYNRKIEELCVKLVSLLGSQETQLDSLLILSQASTKALGMLMEDLGSEGLGAVRSSYCSVAMENIGRDVRNAQQALKDRNDVDLV